MYICLDNSFYFMDITKQNLIINKNIYKSVNFSFNIKFNINIMYIIYVTKRLL